LPGGFSAIVLHFDYSVAQFFVIGVGERFGDVYVLWLAIGIDGG